MPKCTFLGALRENKKWIKGSCAPNRKKERFRRLSKNFDALRNKCQMIWFLNNSRRNTKQVWLDLKMYEGGWSFFKLSKIESQSYKKNCTYCTCLRLELHFWKNPFKKWPLQKRWQKGDKKKDLDVPCHNLWNTWWFVIKVDTVRTNIINYVNNWCRHSLVDL